MNTQVKLFKRMVIGMVALVFIVSAIPLYAQNTRNAKKFEVTKEVAEVVIPLIEALSIINAKSLYEVNLKECASLMIKAITATPSRNKKIQNEDKRKSATVTPKEQLSLCLSEDKYSLYLASEDVKLFLESIQGEFGGIGVTIENKDGKVIVRKLISERPAERAGIQEGDYLIEMREDGTDEVHVFKDIEDVVRNLRGPAGSTVYVVVEREGKVQDPIKITREKVEVATVDYKVIEKSGEKVGYISIGMFTSRTGDEFEMALRTLSDTYNISRVVVDIRGNPGGLLFSVLESLYYFSNKDADIMVTHRTKQDDTVYSIKDPFGSCGKNDGGKPVSCSNFVYLDTGETKSPGEFRDLRVVVLVDKGSASASEIFAGVMKDWGSETENFVVVGKTTYGKGVGQRPYPLSDGSMIKLTTFEFLLGNSVLSINGIGVTPTYNVEDTRKSSKDTATDNDAQFRAALRIWGIAP